jgi:DNA adenine methylase
MLEDVHERLSGVTIERLPYAALITRYDGPGSLFYLDPPYWGCEGDYGYGVFSTADFDAIRGLLQGIKGRFVMSINDRPEIREIFAGFAIEPVEVTYRVGGHPAKARELIITG